MKRLLIYIFLAMGGFSCIEASEVQTRFKMYCMYTPQFKIMYEEYFLPSLKDDFEIVVREYPQECSTGVYQSEGWDKTMLRKLELLTEAVEENWDKVFFYSDIDIIFLKSILETSLSYLGELDFVVQQGWPRNGICAGFFVMRGNKRTLELIKKAIVLMENKTCADDQIALQMVLDNSSQNDISWAFLPSHEFPNGFRVLKKSLIAKKELYVPGSPIVLDDSIHLFHANCTIGIENKYQFLQDVQQIYMNQKLANSTNH